MHVNFNDPTQHFQNQANNANIGKIQPTDDAVYLFIFTPKILINNKIRSYVYQFDAPVVNGLAEYVERENNRSLSRVIPGAIKPDANGIDINTSMYHDKYTFVCIINIVDCNKTINVNRRLVISGYFSDEPFVPHTINFSQPVLNPNAMMHVVHVMNYDYNKTFLNKYIPIPYEITTDMAVFNTEGGPQNPLNDPNIAVNQPFHVMNAFISSKEDGVSFHNVNSKNVYELPHNTSVHKVGTASNKYKNPSAHINSIARAIKNCDAAQSTDSLVPSASYVIAAEGGFNVDRFKKQAIQELDNVDCLTNFRSEDVRGIIPATLGELQSVYHDKLIVIPFKINKYSDYDLKDPTSVDPSTLFANMVAATVSEEATACGLSTVLFRYKSYSVNVVDPILKNKGEWEFSHVASMYQISQQLLMKIVETFKYILENQLFPILKYNAGDFEMVCMHDITQETLVDIHFLNFGSSYTKGFHMNLNRLDHLYNPLLASRNVVLSNYTNLDRFIQHIYDANHPRQIIPPVNANTFVVDSTVGKDYIVEDDDVEPLSFNMNYMDQNSYEESQQTEQYDPLLCDPDEDKYGTKI